MSSRVDLHVHSKFSNRPSEWILRRIGAPECYTEPRAVYEIARRRGMQFVTITDHNCIQGALEIAHLKDVFIGNEITTYFPEDGCKIHVLCWDITEAQFKEIERLRRNIYELRDYLHTENITHACAHPLYRINDRLSVEHFEKLLLLFNVFETMNGGRNQRSNHLLRTILQHLSAQTFEDIAACHRIIPFGVQPWIKGFTGGSDDHSGVFVAKGFTECAPSSSFVEFLEEVSQRRSRAAGFDATPLSFAHSLYSIGYHYYRDRFAKRGTDLLQQALSEVFGAPPSSNRFQEKMSYYKNRLTRRQEKPTEREFKRLVSKEAMKLFGEDWLRDDFVTDPHRYEALNRQTFELASKISNELFFQFAKKFVKKLGSGSIFGSLEAVSAVGPILLGVSPYLFSFYHQSRDKNFLRQVSQRFLSIRPESKFGLKRAWFTDTLMEINGVTTVLHKMCHLAQSRGHHVTLVACAKETPNYPGRMKNFQPIGEFPLPENETITMSFPPFMDILEYCEREQFGELMISTPGMTGLAALATGKILNLPLVGIYHTDFPQYIRYYTDDESMENAAWKYLHWFYSQMETVYVPSRFYRNQLVQKGFEPEKIRLFPHGTDTDQFHPKYRNLSFWNRYRVNGGPKITYVGRVAMEKDLDVLIEVYAQLAQRRPECSFIVVGDGPYLNQMKAALPYSNVVFTGFLVGDDLSQAYASSDVFVFPSTTDTFGNVVLEAMASGVPVVVSDKGGPRETVQHGKTGFVTKGRDPEEVMEAVEQLVDHPDTRLQMSINCRNYAESRSWNRLSADFWEREENDRIEVEDLERWKRLV